MRRAVILCSTASFIMAFLGGILALSLMLPSIVEAQETRIHAERVTVLDDHGTQRVDLSTGPGAKSTVAVQSQDGILRVAMNTGGTQGGGGTQPDQANVAIYSPDGTLDVPAIASLGTGPAGVGSAMVLRDRQGQTRILLGVDADGNPSIQMLDANGNVTWSAQ